jgi:hypothetical protein
MDMKKLNDWLQLAGVSQVDRDAVSDALAANTHRYFGIAAAAKSKGQWSLRGSEGGLKELARFRVSN